MIGVSKGTLETLVGLLKNVTFRNPDNGWTVLRVENADSKAMVTAVGTFPQLEPGETLQMEGNWSEHSKFGKQFQVKSFQPVIPESGEALILYLSSGLFHGMGPVTARRIVERFGDQTLPTLDKHPERLEEIAGLKGKRLADFILAWKELRDSRDTLLFLYSHQITGTTALRLWKHYRSTTLAVIRENPYVLAEEVWGIGFTRADEIALKLGTSKDSYARLKAGLLFTLRKASTQGHTYLPRLALLEQASEILRLVEEDSHNRLLYSLEGLISEQDIDAQGDAMWIPALRRAEESISRWVRGSLEKSWPAVMLTDLERELHRFETVQGIEYAPEQFQGICEAVTSPLYVLTGGPGTGKTTTLKGILHLLDARKERVLLAAPTGRAARRMSELTGREASTLHRLLEIDPSSRKFQRNGDRNLETDWVVVDEFSMVDTWIGAALVQSLSPTTRLLIVGDQDQLPSIGPGSILKELLSCERVPSMRLTRIFRQQNGSDIAENAHRINQGLRPNLNDGTHFHYLQAQSPSEAMQMVLQLVSQTIPQNLQCSATLDIQVLTPMHKGPLGTQALNPQLQATLNTRKHEVTLAGTRWRMGDRVMQLKNDYERGIFNGDVGFIVRMDSEEQELEIDFEGRHVTLPVETLGDLTHAYACTVHKSQGSEYKAVVIVLDAGHYTMLQRNLLYTAVTRAKGGVWIVATPTALDQAIRNNRLTKRFTRLAQSIKAGEQFLEWMEME